MRTTSAPRFQLDFTVWIIIAAVLLIATAAMLFYFA
jgi:hypothetical protein